MLQDKYADYFDVVINCVNKPGTELSALSSARQGGTVFFATLGSDYKLAALTAESMGKELSIVPYTGFMRNHAAFTLALLREFPEAQKFLSPYSTYPSFRRSRPGLQFHPWPKNATRSVPPVTFSTVLSPGHAAPGPESSPLQFHGPDLRRVWHRQRGARHHHPPEQRAQKVFPW